MTLAGLPHSGIHGSKPAYGSPWHFAVNRALLRLLAPRHPPYALSSLTKLSPPLLGFSDVILIYSFFFSVQFSKNRDVLGVADAKDGKEATKEHVR